MIDIKFFTEEIFEIFIFCWPKIGFSMDVHLFWNLWARNRKGWTEVRHSHAFEAENLHRASSVLSKDNIENPFLTNEYLGGSGLLKNGSIRFKMLTSKSHQPGPPNYAYVPAKCSEVKSWYSWSSEKKNRDTPAHQKRVWDSFWEASLCFSWGQNCSSPDQPEWFAKSRLALKTKSMHGSCSKKSKSGRNRVQKVVLKHFSELENRKITFPPKPAQPESRNVFK